MAVEVLRRSQPHEFSVVPNRTPLRAVKALKGRSLELLDILAWRIDPMGGSVSTPVTVEGTSRYPEYHGVPEGIYIYDPRTGVFTDQCECFLGLDVLLEQTGAKPPEEWVAGRLEAFLTGCGDAA
ncbi:hypothetical protein [Shimia abyssi]|uniref:Uncharacterized protein n=1 Tax=Shimia abyssi TaxID=1662395 RepID=A0A2P8FBA7_9RHOB|nr:hypothetical protein [Shimia abyssi]PSL18984.1 hypothetical protein CLV88_108165 [Shimia abyssi]